MVFFIAMPINYLTSAATKRERWDDPSGFWGLLAFLTILGMLGLVGNVMQAKRWPASWWPGESSNR